MTPIIAITMGDAAGVGPEIIVKALAHRTCHRQLRPLVIGDARRLAKAAEIADLSGRMRIVDEPRRRAL